MSSNVPPIKFSRYSPTIKFEELYKELDPKDKKRVEAFLEDFFSRPISENKQVERSSDAQGKEIFFGFLSPDDWAYSYMITFRKEQIWENNTVIDVAILRHLGRIEMDD
jgi:hypothetical protein